MELDLEELAAIIELLDRAEFTDFRFEKGDLRVAVSRGGTLAAPEPVAARLPTRADAPVQQSKPQEPAVSAPEGLAADEVLVKAPMLGTFYRSPKPGEPSFVEVGDKVDADTVVCIVEVMKLMNSVPAGVAGEVTRVFATDGDLVEFDQPLFAVRTIA